MEGLEESYKKLDYLKDYECDVNMVTVLDTLKKWSNMKNTKELQKVIDSMLEIQWHIIELKRDRDLALKALYKYRRDRNTAIDAKIEAERKLKNYEDKHIS